jgi:hypothetical protein
LGGDEHEARVKQASNHWPTNTNRERKLFMVIRGITERC